MAGLRDMLDRFRRAGTPGPAGRAGVPVDRAAERAAELEPVLALVDPTSVECEWIRTHAAADADRIREQAATRAANLVATARGQAAGVRAEAATATRQSSTRRTRSAGNLRPAINTLPEGQALRQSSELKAARRRFESLIMDSPSPIAPRVSVIPALRRLV
ncbi:MAG TPA: hypothetical protein VKG85_12320 [Actinomycetes bacterium]|nr:hypothetical protein [Actinomycetes bacterium]